MFFSVAPLRSRFSDPNGLQREGRPETGQWRSSSLAQLHFMRKPSQCRSACIRTMNSSRGPGKAGAVSLGTVEPSAGRFPQSQLHQGPAPLGSPQGFDPTPPETAGLTISSTRAPPRSATPQTSLETRPNKLTSKAAALGTPSGARNSLSCF